MLHSAPLMIHKLHPKAIYSRPFIVHLISNQAQYLFPDIHLLFSFDGWAVRYVAPCQNTIDTQIIEYFMKNI